MFVILVYFVLVWFVLVVFKVKRSLGTILQNEVNGLERT